MGLREESLELECAKLHNQPQDAMAPKPISKARHVTTWLPPHPYHRFGLPYDDDGEVQSNDDGEKQRPYYDGGGEERSNQRSQFSTTAPLRKERARFGPSSPYPFGLLSALFFTARETEGGVGGGEYPKPMHQFRA